jgi:hypothetical protein
MSEGILNRAHSALAAYLATHSQHPDRIYLGEEDVVEFLREAEKAGLTSSPFLVPIQIFGMRICTVKDAEHHLHVSGPC